jgi:parvulin-like peptidyl-prolyl isomerase
MFDAAKQKQVGFWLIKVADRPEPGKVAVQALLLSDNLTALDVKARLEAGTDNLSNLADQYTQYSLSKDGHGDLGVINESDNGTYTKAFNDYVFNPDTATGVWSAPIRETELWTPGSTWLVKVIERDDNRKVTDEDRNTLISKAFNDWFSGLSADPNLKINNDLLTDKLQQWVLSRASKLYPPTQQAPTGLPQ